jgi:signal transduction histidine kinase
VATSSANSASDRLHPEQPQEGQPCPERSTTEDALSHEELLRAYHLLREENRQRTVALASAAHELKTPLAIMAGYLELLLSGKLGSLQPKQTQVLSAMQVSSSRLQQFVQDFLTYCAFETGKLSIDLQTNDINQCILEIYDIWVARFQDQGVALYFPANGTLPPFRFDYHKVQRVLSNLVENAFFSTPGAGTVWISAELHRWERRTRQVANVTADQRKQLLEKPNSVRITVADTGPGIAPEFHQEIFEDFVSLRRSAENNQGTGLGLAIARRLILAQHGKIWVESEPGAGSKFCFLLPLEPCSAMEAGVNE